jgi:hypothetical protein
MVRDDDIIMRAIMNVKPNLNPDDISQRGISTKTYQIDVHTTYFAGYFLGDT